MNTNSSKGYNLQIELSANPLKVIHSLIKKGSLVALKLGVKPLLPAQTHKNAREIKKERRKAELYSLVSRSGEMPIKAWLQLAVTYYNDTN